MSFVFRHVLSIMMLGAGTVSVLPVKIALADKATQQPLSISDGILRPTRSGWGAAGFFVIHNKGNKDQLLQNISSPVCDNVTANHNNQESIEMLGGEDNIFHRLAIPSQSVMVFPRDGYHLLCRGLKKKLQPGDEVPFTFHFMGNITINISFKMEAR